jgi:hypothetical protein
LLLLLAAIVRYVVEYLAINRRIGKMHSNKLHNAKKEGQH